MRDLKKQFKESVLSRASRLRPVDICNASNGMISQVEAGRWLSGQASKGALFAIQLLCEKIEGGYEVPSVERKERSDKGVPRVESSNQADVGGSMSVSHADGAVSVKGVKKAEYVMEDTSGGGVRYKVEGKEVLLTDGDDIYKCTYLDFESSGFFDLGGKVYSKEVFKKY